MTAGHAGRARAEGLWAALGTLKEQWVVMTFAIGAIFWARDNWETLRALPDALAVERGRISTLEKRVGAVEAAIGEDGVRPRAVLSFPGTGHSAGDAVAGGWSDIRLDPVLAAGGCVPVTLDGFVIDAAGRWFSTEASLALPPGLPAEGALSFALRVPPAVPPGRAEAVVQFVHNCGGRLRSDRSPRLPFRVLPG